MTLNHPSDSVRKLEGLFSEILPKDPRGSKLTCLAELRCRNTHFHHHHQSVSEIKRLSGQILLLLCNERKRKREDKQIAAQPDAGHSERWNPANETRKQNTHRLKHSLPDTWGWRKVKHRSGGIKQPSGSFSLPPALRFPSTFYPFFPINLCYQPLTITVWSSGFNPRL